jgi:hypothetical protein
LPLNRVAVTFLIHAIDYQARLIIFTYILIASLIHCMGKCGIEDQEGAGEITPASVRSLRQRLSTELERPEISARLQRQPRNAPVLQSLFLKQASRVPYESQLQSRLTEYH